MVKFITCEELNKEIGKYLLLDVRTSWEFENSHIENSLNVDSNYLEENKDKLEKENVVFLCRSDARATYSYNQLQLKNSVVLKGGMISWEQHNFKVVKKKIIDILKEKFTKN